MSRKRRFLLGISILLTASVASYLIFWGGLRLWNASLPEDAPRIAMTPDDGWIARLGFTALTYDQIFSRAGGRLVKLEVPAEPDGLKPAEIRKKLEGIIHALAGIRINFCYLPEGENPQCVQLPLRELFDSVD